jgi:hypothetical protein
MNRIDDGHTLSLLACAFTRATGRNFQIEGEIEKEGGTADLIGLGLYIVLLYQYICIVTVCDSTTTGQIMDQLVGTNLSIKVIRWDDGMSLKI